MSILIFGGGIAGLTAAHELLDKGFNVTLIEEENLLGGMAKSRREIKNVPSEHSWRGFAPFYKNTFNIMKRIPISNSKKTVYDNLNLTKPLNFYLLKDKIANYQITPNFLDYIYLFYYGSKYIFSNKRKELFYKEKLVPLLKNKLSKNGYDYIIQFTIGPGIGMEKKDASYAHFYKVVIAQMLSGNKNWYVTNQPTNEAWFNYWEKYLIKKGLKIFKNVKLIKFNLNNDSLNIKSCLIKDKNTNQIITLKADDYILAINPFEAEEILKKSNLNNTQYKLLNFSVYSNQISFRLGFNKKIKFPFNNIAFAMPDSEFDITWYPQDSNFNKNINLGNNIKSLWSGTIIDPYSLSSLYHKPGLKLNKKQLLNEIIYQLLRSKSLQKLIYDNNGFYLNKNDITYNEIWHEWYYDKKNDILKENDKKWVNNIYNEQYRPSQKTNIKNLYLAGAHTKTTINIWSMEGAVESGKIVANLILDKYNKNKTYLYKHNDPIYFNIFKTLDDILYTLNLPSIIDTLLIIIITILIIYYF
jgi:hypothetical protein